MSGLRHLVVVGRGIGALLAALGALAVAAVPSVAASGPASGQVAPQLPKGPFEADPPMAHAKSAALPLAFAPAANSAWKRLKNSPSFAPGTMLLQSDGTVLVHEEPETGGTRAWYRLTPDSKGSYVDGTWSKIAPMPSKYAPLYFASAILPDGRMIVEGGEYNGSNPEGVWTNLGAIYNPATNSWRSVSPPPGWANIGDAQSDVLANGTFVLSQPCQECTSPSGVLTTDDALFNASALSWLVIPGQGKNDPNDEEGWTLEPSGQLLTVDNWLTPTTELFNPTSLTWSFAGNTVTSPVDSPEAEIGPQVEMPGGNTFEWAPGRAAKIPPEPCKTNKPAATALYDYEARRWVKGPVDPHHRRPAVRQRRRARLGAAGWQRALRREPVRVHRPARVLPVRRELEHSQPGAGRPERSQRLHLLHAHAGPAERAGAVQRRQRTDGALHGRRCSEPGLGPLDHVAQLRKLEARTDRPACRAHSSRDSTRAQPTATTRRTTPTSRSYGSPTRQPAWSPTRETSNWSSVSVAPGASSSTEFTVPKTTPAGSSTLVVVANGIASQPVPVTIR